MIRSGTRWVRRLRGTEEGEENVQYERAAIAGIYQRAAHQDLSTRNPVIVIPGVMGSNLVAMESSKTIWGDFHDRDASQDMRLIGLPMKLGAPLDQLQSLSEADGTLGELKSKVGGMTVRLSFYGDVLSALGVGSYSGKAKLGSKYIPDYQADDSTSVAFEFSYDWRRSLDESATALQQFITQATRFLHLQRGNSDPIKFDIVAHSMGGLVLRYFLQYGGQRLPYDGSLPRLNWAGAQQVETAVIVGTPNGGSLKVLDRLVSGLPKTPLTPAYGPIITGTMPSLYQLMPRSRHKPLVTNGNAEAPDLFDPSFWSSMQWGLAGKSRETELGEFLQSVSSAAERREIAMEHLTKCLKNASAFHAAMDIPVASRPSHLRLHLFAGDGKPTPELCRPSRDNRRLEFLKYAPGDGTVLRSSALLDERLGSEWTPRLDSPLQWDSVMFLPSSHMGLTREPVFIDNVLYLLLEKPRVGR